VANPFVHVELNTPNPERAKAFYSKLFQWQLEDVQTLPFPMVPIRDQGWRRHRRGILKQIPGVPRMAPYVQVDDLHAATQKAKSLGAR